MKARTHGKRPCRLGINAVSKESLLCMLQAGVIVSDYASLMIEILKDNASPQAGAVYTALDMPWAVLVGQIAHAYGK